MIAMVNLDTRCLFGTQKVKNGEVSKFDFYYRKIIICDFSQGATQNFLILPILETSDLLFSYSIGILNGPQKFEMFFVLTSVYGKLLLK